MNLGLQVQTEVMKALLQIRILSVIMLRILSVNLAKIRVSTKRLRMQSWVGTNNFLEVNEYHQAFQFRSPI